jgi:23S rRNA (pseudouridine1915-N3)-methyltransferase
MKLMLWTVGGKHESYVAKGIENFTQRIGHYYPCEWKMVASPKNAGALSLQALKEAESATLLQALDPVEFVVFLDERGKMLSSPELAGLIETRAINGARKVHFVIGGAFGVNDEVRKRADLVWQLSKLVFPHQLVRLILAEQLYRACTIIKGEKYHHE